MSTYIIGSHRQSFGEKYPEMRPQASGSILLSGIIFSLLGDVRIEFDLFDQNFFSKKASNHQNSWEFLTTSELSGVLFKPMSGTESALKLQLTYKIPVSDYDMEFLLLLN